MRFGRFLAVGLAVTLGLTSVAACKSKDDSITLAKPAPESLAPKPGDGTAAPRAPSPTPSPEETAIRETSPAEAEEATEEAEPRAERPRGRKRASSSRVEAQKVTSEAATLGVKRILFSEQIDKREPVDPEDTFSSGQTKDLYAFVELTNPSKEKQKVIVSFVPPMGSPSKVELGVGDKSRWRTWAKKHNPKAIGTWTVIVSDEQGREIGRRTFEVTD